MATYRRITAGGADWAKVQVMSTVTLGVLDQMFPNEEQEPGISSLKTYALLMSAATLLGGCPPADRDLAIKSFTEFFTEAATQIGGVADKHKGQSEEKVNEN